MGILDKLLHFMQDADPSAQPPDGVQRIAETVSHLGPERAIYLASFAYILSRVAHVDQYVQAEERHTMALAIERHGGLPADQAGLVADLALEQSRLFAGTEDFDVTLEFRAVATHDEKLALIDCLFAVCASDRALTVREDNEIRRVCRELRVEHADFISIRARYRDRMTVMHRDPDLGD